MSLRLFPNQHHHLVSFYQSSVALALSISSLSSRHYLLGYLPRRLRYLCVTVESLSLLAGECSLVTGPQPICTQLGYAIR